MVNTEKLKRLKMALPLIGIGIFVYIVQDIGPEKIYEALMNIDPVLMAISFLIFFPRITLSTYKWQLVAKTQGIEVGLPTMIQINIIGLFYGTITPSGLGDWMRIFYLKEESGDCFGKCTSNVIIDQFIELFSLFILALFGSLLIIEYFPGILVALLCCGAFFAFIIFLFEEKKRGKRLLKMVYDIFVPERLKQTVAAEFDAFYHGIPPLTKLVIPFLIAVFCYALFFVQIYIVALSFSIDIPLLEFILVYAIASLIGLIPVTVSGLGTREGTLIHLLAIYGIAEQDAVAISLAGYVITYLLPSIMGGVLSLVWASNASDRHPK